MGLCKIPNYLKKLVENVGGNNICVYNQRDLIKNLCSKENIKDLSRKLGVSDRLLYYWVKGERPIPIAKLIKLAEFENKKILCDVYENTEYVYINGVKQKTRLCKYLTPELAYLVGYIFGDGHIGNYSFSICDCSESNIKLAKKLLKDIFNLDVNYRFRSDRNCYEIGTSWKVGVLILNKVFEMPVGSKNKRLAMPSLIRDSNMLNKSMFCFGLMTADFGGNSLTQTSYKILEDVKKVLRKMEIRTCIYGPYGPYKGNESKKWILSFDKASQFKITNSLNNAIKLFS